jgi:ATP-dependent RNA helicase DeaD
MEILNNVQLEGRRINVEISKMMVAEDVIITEEVQVVVLVAEEVQLQEEGSFAPREGSGGGFRSDRVQQREGGFGPRSSSAPRREGGLHQTDQEQKVHDRAPRRSENFGDTRPRRPRRD